MIDQPETNGAPANDRHLNEILGDPVPLTLAELAAALDHAVPTLAKIEGLRAAQGQQTDAERHRYAAKFLFDYVVLALFPDADELDGGLLAQPYEWGSDITAANLKTLCQSGNGSKLILEVKRS